MYYTVFSTNVDRRFSVDERNECYQEANCPEGVSSFLKWHTNISGEHGDVNLWGTLHKNTLHN